MSPRAPHSAAVPEAETSDLERRRFLARAWRWTSGGLLAGGLLLADRFLRGARATPRTLRLTHDEVARAIARGGDVVGEVLIAGTVEQPVARSLRCTHLGCRVRATAEQLVCPCHGSRFDRQGARLAGPARGDLVALALRRTDDGWQVTLPDGDGHG